MSLLKEHFYINSNYRKGGTHENFTYEIKLPSGNLYNQVAMLAASIPKTFYIFPDQYNSFILQEGTDLATITIPEGNYGRTSLANVVKSLLNSNSPNGWTYNITFNSGNNSGDDGKYTFSVSGNASVQPSFIFTTNSPHEQLGFEINSTNTFVSDSLRSTGVIKIILEDCIFVRSDICKNFQDNVLQEIYTADNPSYTSIVFKNHDYKAYGKSISDKTTDMFNFWITDENNVPILLNNNNVNFTLIFWKE